jgi:CRISPR-associated protein Cas2
MYDVKDDTNRSALATRLIYYGMQRVQYSVFRGIINARDKMLVEGEIRDLMDDSDKVHIIDLCETCRKNLIAIGDVPAAPQHLIL